MTDMPRLEFVTVEAYARALGVVEQKPSRDTETSLFATTGAGVEAGLAFGPGGQEFQAPGVKAAVQPCEQPQRVGRQLFGENRVGGAVALEADDAPISVFDLHAPLLQLAHTPENPLQDVNRLEGRDPAIGQLPYRRGQGKEQKGDIPYQGHSLTNNGINKIHFREERHDNG